MIGKTAPMHNIGRIGANLSGEYPPMLVQIAAGIDFSSNLISIFLEYTEQFMAINQRYLD